MTTKLTHDEKQVLNDYINYWMNEYLKEQIDMSGCSAIIKHIINKPTSVQIKNPRLITNLANMIVVRYILDKEDDSEEED